MTEKEKKLLHRLAMIANDVSGLIDAVVLGSIEDSIMWEFLAKDMDMLRKEREE